MPDAQEDPRAYIERRARELGFSAVGFARAEPLEPEGPRYLAWLERGYAAGMAWLGQARARRLDPAAAYGARSVAVFAMPYGPRQSEPRPGEGRVARYARGRDYHNLVGKRLRKLARELRLQHGDSRARAYVDTGPVLEKAWAARAGLGWIAKNTLLLSAPAGSYRFLGVILSGLELAPSPPAVDQCGSCRLCLEACPTAAFPQEYVLDARRCLSYLTIEERGPIDEALRPLLGDHLFGCDICQEVCPFNRAALETVDPDLLRGAEHEALDTLLGLDDQAFATRYRGRALQRARREGLARNAAVVAGLSRDPGRVPALARALEADPSPLVRAHAAWALGTIGGPEARATLELAGRRDPDAGVRTEALKGLESR